ncbi:MAG: SRPBCC family protein [Caldilineaceae bacterium]
MAFNTYHFITYWRVQATAVEVAAVLGDALGLPRWWPSVYLAVEEVAPGDANGLGRVIDLYTKGWLPYTLRWRFRVTAVEPLQQIVLEADGDFIGRGIWTLQPDGDWVNITYDWQITARKPLLRYLSVLFKPLFAANHHWAMRQGEESLRLEIARRRAKTAAERTRIPPPPAPTPTATGAFGRYLVRKGLAVATRRPTFGKRRPSRER